MKNFFKLVILIITVSAAIMISGCTIQINTPGNDSQKPSSSEITKTEKTTEPQATMTPLTTQVSQDGVTYLVNNGKLIISGEGKVTQEAIASITPEYNVVDFEHGTFDIGDDAFNGCSHITDIIMRNNVQSIGDRAFKGCSMAVVVLGSSITDIGEDAFTDCCHEYVLIANKDIFENLNSRYDFGNLCATADNIGVHEDLIPFEYGADYSTDNNIVGEFLAASEKFDNLGINKGDVATVQRYDYSTNFEAGFMAVYGSVWPILDNSNNYDTKTNMINYCIDVSFWEELGINVEFYNKDYVDGYTITITAKPQPQTETINQPKPTSTLPPKPTQTSNADCKVCGGDGKKECASCHGKGYSIDYESGSGVDELIEFSDGTKAIDHNTIRAVKKNCPVCNQTGKVKCLSCA